MKNFSNETINLRRKAIFKVILKRYSWIVCFSLLLYLCNIIGRYFIIFAANGMPVEWNVIQNILVGFISLFILLLGLLEGYYILNFIFLIITDKTMRLIMKNLGICILMFFAFIFQSILKSPVFLWRRIKDEKRRFKDSLNNEMRKQEISISK